MKIRDILSLQEFSELPLISDIIFTEDGSHGEQLNEGKWISGRFDRNIRIDQPTHGTGQRHGHVLGRKGHELVVVNVDGSASHGKKGRLHKRDANALRADGFEIPSDNIIEWTDLDGMAELILG
jgi:hypothetical protein